LPPAASQPATQLVPASCAHAPGVSHRTAELMSPSPTVTRRRVCGCSKREYAGWYSGAFMGTCRKKVLTSKLTNPYSKLSKASFGEQTRVNYGIFTDLDHDHVRDS